MTIGIIGAGCFGQFLAEKLAPYAEIRVYSQSDHAGQYAASLEVVAASDWLIPCIPLQAYRDFFTQAKQHIGQHTVVVDICSVKQEPIEIISELLPQQRVVATHPLFGPESAAETVSGHVVVLCPELSDHASYARIKKFLAGHGLTITEMSGEEHDKEMALVQGLTFYIARALKGMHLHKMKLETPSFKRLRHLAELEAHHSDELFKTIQQGNVYTPEIRAAFLREAKAIHKLLDD